MIVLMPHCGFLSETSRMIEIARALRARGEEILLATHGGPYLPVLQDSGLPFAMLSPSMDRERCERFVRDLVQIGRPGLRLQPPDEVRASVAAEAALLRERRARAVVIGFTLTACLSARVAGVPVVASHGGSYVPPVLERGLVPVPTTMPVPGTEWLPARLKHWMMNHRTDRMTGPVKFLNTIADELGVERVPSLAALMLGDLTLVTDTAEVLGVPSETMRRWTPRRPQGFRRDTRLVYTGPLYARLDVPIPPPVERFLDGTRPTALVVLSSANAALLRAVTAQVRSAGPRVIVGATIHDFGPNDDADVVVAGMLPNHLVMPRVDVAVTMGGQGTVQTAMAAGTPLVGIPLHPEQELNVGTAVRHGMARAVAPRHAGTARLADAVRAVLADPRHRQAAQRVRGAYAGVDGAANAAAAILDHLERAASRPAAAPGSTNGGGSEASRGGSLAQARTA